MIEAPTPQARTRRREILWLLAAAHVIGVVAGFASHLFELLIPLVQGIFFEGVVAFDFRRPIPPTDLGSPLDVLRHLLAPAFGALFVGLILRRLAPDERGHGVAEVLEAVAIRNGKVRARGGALRIITAALTIGSGGSAGKEGPTIHIGAAAGSLIGGVLRLPARRRKVLVACGASAGIAIVFNAPFAGVLFAIEILLGEIFLAAFAPIMISASVAAVIRHHLIGSAPLFTIPAPAVSFLVEPSFGHAAMFALVGVVAGLAGVLYTRTLHAAEDAFQRFVRHAWLRPAAGGLIVGAIGLGLPMVLGEGHHTVEASLVGEGGFVLLAAVALVKIVATACTVGSGGSGGVFAPALVIGAALGAACGGAFAAIPSVDPIPPGAFAVVAMAGVVAGSMHAPITAVLFVLAITQQYRIVLPVLVSTVASLATSSLLLRDSIYTWRLRARGLDVRAGREETVLRLLRVDAFMRPPVTVPAEASFHEVAETLLTEDVPVVAVVGAGDELLGVIAAAEVREFLRNRTMDSLLIARELAERERGVARDDEDVFTVMQRMTLEGIEGMVVMKGTRVVGVIARRQILDAYQDALRERAAEREVVRLT